MSELARTLNERRKVSDRLMAVVRKLLMKRYP